MAKFGLFNLLDLATLIATAAFPRVLDLINGLNWHAHGSEKVQPLNLYFRFLENKLEIVKFGQLYLCKGPLK